MQTELRKETLVKNTVVLASVNELVYAVLTKLGAGELTQVDASREMVRETTAMRLAANFRNKDTVK